MYKLMLMLIDALAQVVVAMGQSLESQTTDEEVAVVFHTLTLRQTVCNVFAAGHVLGLVIGFMVGSVSAGLFCTGLCMLLSDLTVL